MSRHNSAPTHAWVLMSQVNKWLALIFVAIIFVLTMVGLGVTNQVKTTCQPYTKTITLGVYSLDLTVRDGDGMCVTHE